MDLLDTKAKDVHTHRGFDSRKREYFRQFVDMFWEKDMKRNFGSDKTAWTYPVPGQWLASNATRRGEYPTLTFTLYETLRILVTEDFAFQTLAGLRNLAKAWQRGSEFRFRARDTNRPAR